MPSRPFNRLPTTLLSGFLGSGKTTIVNSLLRQASGRRVALVVNDMGAVNIDADLLEGAVVNADATLVELSNGCICCTLREDLLAAVAQLANEQRFDHLIVESSGISEPLPAAKTFTFTTGDGTLLSELAFVDAAITVVDGKNFLPMYRGGAALQGTADDERSISDLLVEQVEFANVLVVSKTDVLSPEEFSTLEAVLHAMNPTATVVKSANGSVCWDQLIGTGLFDLTSLQNSPAWVSALREEKSSEADEYGISSFVWTARRPLHPERFHQLLGSDWKFGQLFRSKGFLWLATNRDLAVCWNQAGGSLRLTHAGRWWADVPQSAWPPAASARNWIQSKWHEQVGDRRQEVVFIGRDLESTALGMQLSACLLTDVELSRPASHWDQYSDLFALCDAREELLLLA